MKEIKVSVWCLAYNHGKYIEKTLQGFINQKTNFAFEVIVHDDASTDETAEIIRRYAEAYPDIFIPFFEEENQYSRHVNMFAKYFLSNAKGCYFAFCEGDDYWCDENKLQKQYDFLETHKNVAMCVHRVQHIEENGKLIENEYEPKRDIIDADREISQSEFAELLYVKSEYPFHTSSYFMRSQVIRDRNEDFVRMYGTLNGDQVYLRFALLYGDVYYINSVMSMRRIGAPYSYNVLKRKLDKNQLMEKSFAECRGELLFDKISGGKYTGKIGSRVLNQVLDYLPESPAKPFIDWIRQYVMTSTL